MRGRAAGRQVGFAGSEACLLPRLQTADRHLERRLQPTVLTWTFPKSTCRLARRQVLGTRFPDV